MLIADAIGGIWQPAHEVVSTQGRLWACLRPQSAHRPTPISSDALLAEMGCRFCGPRHHRSGCDYDSPCYGWLIDGSVECLELSFLSAGDQKWIMGRRMCEWFGWPLPQ